MSKLPPKLIFASAGLLLFFLCAGGAIAYLLLSSPSHDYPDGDVIEGHGRCGTKTWLQRGRSIRLERYRCVLTTNTDNDVFIWYIRNGYTPTNGGLIQKEIGEGLIPITHIERIYFVNQKDGTIMVRIYDDTTIRAP